MGIQRPGGPYALEMTAGSAWPSADEDSYFARADELASTLRSLTGAREDWEQHRNMLFGGDGVWSGRAATAAATEIDSHASSMNTLQQQLRTAGTQATTAGHAIADAKKAVTANVEQSQQIIEQINNLAGDEDVTGLIQQVVVTTYGANTEVVTAAAARLTAPPTAAPDSAESGIRTFGARGVKESPGPKAPSDADSGKGLPEQNITAVPADQALRPSQPIDPRDPYIGDERFGYWENVTTPLGPYTTEGKPPLTTEFRKFPKESMEGMTGKPTDWFVPKQSWMIDDEGPGYQLQEQYRFRVSGVEATPYARVVAEDGKVVQQRWVRYSYEVQHNYSGVMGGDLAGVPRIGGPLPADWGWQPTTINDIAKLSGTNPGTKFYVPDSCGKNFIFEGGVPSTGSSGRPPSPPIMTRPR